MSGELDHSPATIISQLLVDLGLGTLPADSEAWPVYTSVEPNAPDNVITVFDTQGANAGRHMKTGERQEFHGIQVRVRSAEYPVGYAKAREIAVALDEEVYRTEVLVEFTTYLVHSISRSSDVLSLGKDSPRTARRLFTVNATTTLAKQL